MPFLDVTVVIANELLLPKDPGRIKNTIYTPSLKFGILRRQVPLREWNWIGYSCSHSLLAYCVSGTLHAPCKTKWNILVSSVYSVVFDSLGPHGLQHTRPPCPSPTPGVYLNSLMSIALGMPYNHLILCCPLLFLPAIFHSIRVFSNDWVHWIRWPKYWSFSFSIGPSNEYSGLISFRMDWLDLCAAQATLKSLLQHHSSRASIHSGQDPLIPGLAHFVTLGKSLTLSGPHSFL